MTPKVKHFAVLALKVYLALMVISVLFAVVVMVFVPSDTSAASTKKTGTAKSQPQVPAEVGADALSLPERAETLASPLITAEAVRTSKSLVEDQLHAGMTADDVFALIPKSDEVGTPLVESDPNLPGSLLVVHAYQIDGKRVMVVLSRETMDSPYTVLAIGK